MASGDHVVIINMCLYIVLFISCWYKCGWRNLSTFLSLLYVLSAVSAYFLYNHPMYHTCYKNVREPSIDGCLCLFIINTAFILTFSYFRLSKYICISKYNSYWMKQCQKCVVALLSIYLIFDLPMSVYKYFMATELSRMRDAIYGTHNEHPIFIISLISRTVGSMPVVILTMAFINRFLFRRVDIWDKISVYIYLLMNIDIMLSYISRSTFVFSMIEVIVILITFSAFIHRKAKRKIYTGILIIFSGLFVVFTTISFARFGDINKSAKPAVFAALRYSGEAQLNFMTWMYPDMKYPLYGYKQFPLFRRALGMEYSDGLERKGKSVYNPYIKKIYKYSHPFHVFYGLAGNYVFNWGCAATIILFVSVCIWLRRIHKGRSPDISAFNIIITVVLASYYGKGVFYGDYRFESGNLLMLFLLFLYFYLKNTGRTYFIKGVARY